MFLAKKLKNSNTITIEPRNINTPVAVQKQPTNNNPVRIATTVYFWDDCKYREGNFPSSDQDYRSNWEWYVEVFYQVTWEDNVQLSAPLNYQKAITSGENC